MKNCFKILTAISLTILITNASAEPVNGAGGDWVCKAGPGLLNYVYPYASSDYNRALIHIMPFANPSPQGYQITKIEDNKVTDGTANGTPFECTKELKNKK